MKNYNAIIAQVETADANNAGYGMLGDLVGYLQNAIDGGFEFCEVDHFCDEMNDDYCYVLEGAGLDENDDMTDELREASGRVEIGQAFELIEEGYNVERGDSADTDYAALAELLVTAIEKRVAWLATL